MAYKYRQRKVPIRKKRYRCAPYKVGWIPWQWKEWPVPELAAQRQCESATRTRRQADAQSWSSIKDLERFAAGKAGTGIVRAWGVRKVAITENVQQMLALKLSRAISEATEMGIEMHEPVDGLDATLRHVKFTLTLEIPRKGTHAPDIDQA